MEKKKKEDKYYLPRDISWMYFNRRILQESHERTCSYTGTVELFRNLL
jgi:polyphosphate kinase